MSQTEGKIHSAYADSVHFLPQKIHILLKKPRFYIHQISAKSGQTLNTASLNLTLTQTGATDVAAWKYVTFTGEGDAAALVEGKSGSFNVLDTAPVDLHNGASVTGGTDVVYYLMIYLENKNESQNEPGDNLATGSYVGKVTFQAAGGTVSATFAA